MKPESTNLKNTPSECPFELLQRCGNSDQRAQLQVYKLFYKNVFSICRQMVNDRIEAESLMHESFLLAFENIQSYTGEISFSSWINKFIYHAMKQGNINF